MDELKIVDNDIIYTICAQTGCFMVYNHKMLNNYDTFMYVKDCQYSYINMYQVSVLMSEVTVL